jgi:hypothetical protein
VANLIGDPAWIASGLRGKHRPSAPQRMRCDLWQGCQSHAGLLDLLALDRGSDTYYSIGVQLGEIDGSHSFRVFDYWARNRVRIAGKTHVAVLMAENASGRFRPALANTVPSPGLSD